MCSECGEKLKNIITKSEWYCLNDCEQSCQEKGTLTVYTSVDTIKTGNNIRDSFKAGIIPKRYGWYCFLEKSKNENLAITVKIYKPKVTLDVAERHVVHIPGGTRILNSSDTSIAGIA